MHLSGTTLLKTLEMGQSLLFCCAVFCKEHLLFLQHLGPQPSTRASSSFFGLVQIFEMEIGPEEMESVV